MSNVKHMLKAIYAFIVINQLESFGIDYIDRLSKAAQICEDEYTWKLFSDLFDNDQICKIYLKQFETSLD